MAHTGIRENQQSGVHRYVAPNIYYVLGDALRKAWDTVKSEELFELAVKENIFIGFWQRTAFHIENVKSKHDQAQEKTKTNHL